MEIIPKGRERGFGGGGFGFASGNGGGIEYSGGGGGVTYLAVVLEVIGAGMAAGVSLLMDLMFTPETEWTECLAGYVENTLVCRI